MEFYLSKLKCFYLHHVYFIPTKYNRVLKSYHQNNTSEMGRKGQQKQYKHDSKQKQTSNLSANQRTLHQVVDKLLRLTTTPTEQNTTTKNLEVQKEISELTDQVQELEVEIEFSTTSERYSSSILDRFTNWMEENGAKFDGTKISEFPGYELGLMAEVDIKESSLVIAVPRDLMLTHEAAKKSVLRALIEKDPLLNNMPNVALAMFVLLEKFKGNSFWKPYIDILPKRYSTVLYFDLDDLKELQASPTLESALKQIKNIVRQYAYFYKLIWASDDPACKILRKHFTFNQYRWAVSTVMTRQNSVPSEDGTVMMNALIPLWDLCNHTNGNISTDYNPELKRSECLAVRNFKAGEQIFIFYGPRGNGELFIHNGFVYEDNAHDYYALRLGISKSDPLKEQRAKLLNGLALPEHGEFWIKTGPRPISEKLLAFLRIFSMNEEQLQYWLENDKVNNLEKIECSLEASLKNKYWNFLLTRLKLILATYKTKLEEDLKLIEDNQLSYNRILAIRMRVTEKKILTNAIAYVEEQRLKQ